jgi:flagellar protein FliS
LSGFGTRGFTARTYGRIGLETDVIEKDPHRLVLMLFDGALLSVRRARTALDAKRVAEKCQAIGHAIEIVDSGLRASVDASHDPQFAGRLVSLYQYIVMRLLQANLRNDGAALNEAGRLLEDLRGAWARIAPEAGQAARDGAAPAAPATAAEPRRDNRAQARVNAVYGV